MLNSLRKQCCATVAYFFIYFPYLYGKTKRTREAGIFLLLPNDISNTYDRRTDTANSHKKAVDRADKIQFLSLELQCSNYKTCIA